VTGKRSVGPADQGLPGVTPTAMPPSARRIIERGRSKAYRPLPRVIRAAAVERGLAAYGRGAWYLAHEELEPAWMGTDDPAERALLSGLIKLAAAYVHVARGNPLGVRTNLRGARDRLATAGGLQANPDGTAGAAALQDRPATTGDPQEGPTGAAAWIDLPSLLAAVDDRLVRIEARCAEPPGAGAGRVLAAAPSHDVAGPAGRFRGAPVDIPRVPLPRRPG
jgi:hypothetical protein